MRFRRRQHAAWAQGIRALLVAGLLAGWGGCVCPAQQSGELVRKAAAREAEARLTPAGDGLVLELPVAGLPGAGSARVTAELLDPANAVLRRGDGVCGAGGQGNGSVCRARLSAEGLRPAVSTGIRHNAGTTAGVGDLPRYRVHYVVSVAGSAVANGVLALERIAPALFELHLAAPKSIRPGAPYVARVRAVQPLTQQPVAAAVLKATLTGSYREEAKPDAIFGTRQVTTDAEGYASISFTAPAAADLASVDLDVAGAFGGLAIAASETLDVPKSTQLSLTTDKPLYQPGQTVHVRLLLLDPAGQAATGRKVRIDFSDPDSTLVHRVEAVSSSFGIATADWAVPARMRLGEYELNAKVEDADGVADFGRTASARVRLSSYDLPTFVVNPKPDKPFYLPGSEAAVEVRGEYLFGQPVRHGHVRVVREQSRNWDFEKQKWVSKESQAVSGELDVHGHFLARVPLQVDGRGLRGRQASGFFEDLRFVAYLTDGSTGRTEQRRFDVRVAAQSLRVNLSSGEHVRGLPQLYNLTVTTADGLPAASDVTLSLLPPALKHDTLAKRVARAARLEQLHTDAKGLARLKLPSYEELLRRWQAEGGSDAEDEGPEIWLAARDSKGDSGSTLQPLEVPRQRLRVTTAATLMRPGEPLAISVDTADPSLKQQPVTVELLRQTRRGPVTIMSREVTLAGGHGELSVGTDAQFRGVVFVLAEAVGVAGRLSGGAEQGGGCYYNCGDAATATASQAVLFPEDNALHVEVRMSAESYRPGEQATASVSVRGPQDPDGEEAPPAPSALGVVAVDQAVALRNLTDSDFGGSGSSFFFPSSDFGWAIGGFSLSELKALDPAKPFPEGAELAAEFLVGNLPLAVETASSVSTQGVAQAFKPWFDGQLLPARTALAVYLHDHTELPTDSAGLQTILAPKQIDLAELRDPWGMPYRLVATPDHAGHLKLTLRCAGPDKRPGTEDDFSVDLADWRWFNGRAAALQHAVSAYHARTGRFIRGLADLRDEMRVEGIDLDAWRDPWGQPFIFRFPIERTAFTADVRTLGEPGYKPANDFDRGPYFVGGASIKYTSELESRVMVALEQYARGHGFPRTQAQFQAALRAAGVAQAGLVDAWRHPLRASFRTHSVFTDRVHTEAHATPGGQPVLRTTTTPVTAIEDLVELHSAGPDGRWATSDDFLVAGFAHTRSEQSAQEATPKKLARAGIVSGPAGTVLGTVVDQTGAVIPGAKVEAKNVTSGDTFETKSDGDGRFVLGPLPAGRYTVTLDMAGFLRLVYDQVVVAAGGNVTLDAKLSVGAMNESVTVSAQLVTLETTNADVAGVSGYAGVSGGVPGGVRAGMVMPAPPPPPPGAAAPTPRLREYFPETLLWRPEIVTAADGSATLKFPVADNITAWTVSAAASTRLGNTGAGVAAFRTFQPFFAAFDPPPILTVNDRIALPVTLRNYLDHGVTVASAIEPADWFRLSGASSLKVNVGSQEAASPVFAFTALRPVVGAKQRFTAKADAAGDRIERPVTVHPDGLEAAVTAAGILRPGQTVFALDLPQETLAGSAVTTLRVYPNLGARLRDALAAMVASPHGCAEQIISTAWPSLLLKRYARSLSGEDAKLETETQHDLEEAYENLLANHRASGGFSYWPNDPVADLAVTAYAIDFLTQVREFVPVDEQMLTSAVTYLQKQQQKDGRWVRMGRDGGVLTEDRRENAMLTASVAAMIVGAPGSEPLLKRAVAGLEPFVAEWDEPYTLAGYTLAALGEQDTARAAAAVARLRAMALTENGGAYWALESNTPFFGWGRAGRVESTALVLRALVAAGAGATDEQVTRGVLFLNHEQDRHTLWYSTQATARVLDVLAAAVLDPHATANAAAGPAGARSLRVVLDQDREVRVALPAANEAAGPIQVELPGVSGGGRHRLELTLPDGASSATAQAVTSFYRPWAAQRETAAVTNHEQLRLSVVFSTLRPVAGQAVTVSARVERVGFRGYGMMVAEVGLPPGADVDRASLEAALAAAGSEVNQYEVLPDRVLFYLWPRAGGVGIKFRFTERYAVDALCAPSTVYDFYNPDARLTLEPQRFAMNLGSGAGGF